MIKVLFIGDIMGKIGRKTVAKIIPRLEKREKIDLIIANAENSAHGLGTTPSVLEELIKIGINFFTSGDHAFSRLKQLNCYEKFPIIHPANYPPGVPGKGFDIVTVNKNKILIINLIGRVFMKQNYDCPFRKIDEILNDNSLKKQKISATIIDIHAESTSEKICLKHYLDGRVSALLGTHTHVMTSDHEITKKGTAYITDVGMTGFIEGSLGVNKEEAIKTFKDQIKYQFTIPETGKAIFSAVIITLDPKTAKAKSIKPITSFVNII